MSVRSRAVVALALLCALTGCAEGADAGPERDSAPKGAGPSAPVPPPGKEARAIKVPLDRYDPSPADLEVISAAEDVLTAKCMRGKGLDWKQAPRSAEEDAEPRNRRRYGVVEPGIAKIYGYHLPADRPTVARRAAARKAREKGLDAAARKAAYGPQRKPGQKGGGCVDKSKEALVKDVPDADFGLLDKTLGATYERSMKDRKVKRVFRAWSACMKKKGYAYPGPMEAITDKRWMKGDQVSRAEIRQARTDVRCKEKTDLVAVWNAAENRIQHAAIKSDAAAFQKLERAQHTWMTAARRVL
ncbi:hypothetical protein [Streptomyces sp. NPDC048172]|uniref:hypothetical protein n=1 Tax=Streptomyces sp. NPDC048172 TaxID=3365505 RepID=UPI0037138196